MVRYKIRVLGIDYEELFKKGRRAGGLQAEV